jgi:hypothetical protein
VHAPFSQDGALAGQATALPHCPLGLQVSTPLPEHFLAPGVQTPVHPPDTHASFAQVVTGVSETRSGPHFTTVVPFEQTFAPGLAPVQLGSMGWHVPWLMPAAVSQSWPDAHV